jgi:heme-degrading monooxygenase HmoA
MPSPGAVFLTIYRALLYTMRSFKRRIHGIARQGDSQIQHGDPRENSGAPIVRVWKGVTAERVADSYLTHIQATGIPAYRAIKGNSAVYVLRRVENGVAEFIVISLWDSWDAVQEFTQSDDVNTAVYFDEDRVHLMFQEPRVAHYEVAAVADPITPNCEINPFEGTS